MSLTSYKIATIWGIPVKLHCSVLIRLVAFVHWFGWRDGILLEIGLSASIVLHELGHCFVAQRKGCRVRDITLMIIGGAAQMEQIPRRPRDEAIMAAAGPAVSLILGVALIIIGLSPIPLSPMPVLGSNVVVFLGALNVTLVVFNLLPAFPMDGGRILRASLTPFVGRLRATSVAALLGKIIALCFGILGFFTFDASLYRGAVLVSVAFFVYIAAGHEHRMLVAQQHMGTRGAWPDLGNSSDIHVGGDEVTVGPPPYGSGPSAKAQVGTAYKD